MLLTEVSAEIDKDIVIVRVQETGTGIKTQIHSHKPDN